MTKTQQKIFRISVVCALLLGVVPAAGAMHIMEGYLPLRHCILWGVVAIPFVVAGLFSIQRTLRKNPRTVTILAMAGAFIFVISSMKIPSVTASCSHMTGTGLGAILFGPSAVSVLGLIVLLFQALLLAHGGLTSLGANLFSMAIVGPFVSYGIYKLCRRCRVNSRVAVFLAACLGDLLTYCATSIQLALAHPAATGGVATAAMKFLGVFAPTQLPLAIVEGLLTVVIMIVLESYAQPELRSIGLTREAH